MQLEGNGSRSCYINLLVCGPDCIAGCVILQAATERGMTQLEFLRSKEDMSGIQYTIQPSFLDHDLYMLHGSSSFCMSYIPLLFLMR